MIPWFLMLAAASGGFGPPRERLGERTWDPEEERRRQARAEEKRARRRARNLARSK